MADSAKLNGWKNDIVNGYLEVWQAGTKVAEFDASNGLKVVVDAFDLAGQTISTANASGSTDLTTWAATFNGASGANDECPKYAFCITVGGTAYYAPCFTSV